MNQLSGTIPMMHAITGICFVMSFSSMPLNAQAELGKVQASFTADEREYAKRIDADLAKECRVTDELPCQRTNLILQAQESLAAWGYGVKFTAEADADTTAAIRLYQQRSGLPGTGKLDGLTVVRMEADEKAVEEHPFTLPPFYFYEKYFTHFFGAEGVFRNTATGQTSGAIIIRCDKDSQVCIEVESTAVGPDLSEINVKEWTHDHIVAENEGTCFTHQLRIERASKTIVRTKIKTNNDGPCAPAPGDLPSLAVEELVDGMEVSREHLSAQGTAERRVKLFSGAAQSLMKPVAEKK
jgi:hypothetical protein